MLYRLVYLSTNRIQAAPEAFRAEVEQILRASRRNNAMVGVTGALMFSSGHFGQVLEGPRAAVEATFERIQQDTRHGDVSLLEFKPTGARGFDDWAMAYVGQGDTISRNWTADIDFAKITAEALLTRLHSLVAREVSPAG